MSELLRNPLGPVLLVVGIILPVWGYNASQSLESRISNIVSGSPSDQAIYLYITRTVCVGLGPIQLVRALR